MSLFLLFDSFRFLSRWYIVVIDPIIIVDVCLLDWRADTKKSLQNQNPGETADDVAVLAAWELLFAVPAARYSIVL